MLLLSSLFFTTALEAKINDLSNAYSTFANMVDPKQIVDAIHEGKFRCVAKTESEANDQKIVPGAVKIMLRKIGKGKEIQRNNLMFVPVSTK